MNLQVLRGTREQYSPSTGLNISMDFNAVEGGGARGTEVVIPDNASPEVRAAAERYNQLVRGFAQRYGIEDYPIRGVRTRSENQRGVSNTIHAEPFFNTDTEMQNLIRQNPEEFADLYRQAFGDLDARLIAPHGVGNDRGAASEIFGDETSYGELMLSALLGGDISNAGPGEALAGAVDPGGPSSNVAEGAGEQLFKEKSPTEDPTLMQELFGDEGSVAVEELFNFAADAAAGLGPMASRRNQRILQHQTYGGGPIRPSALGRMGIASLGS